MLEVMYWFEMAVFIYLHLNVNIEMCSLKRSYKGQIPYKLRNHQLLAYIEKHKYCNVFGWLETPFGLVIGFINNPQVVTTITYNTVTHLHT
jgi:hypothetical protein